MKRALSLLFVLSIATPLFANPLIEFADGNYKIINSPDTKFEEIKHLNDDSIKAHFGLDDKWSYVRIEAKNGSWDLSKYQGVEVTITNEGNAPAKPGVRIDQAGDLGARAWNTALLKEIQPGETETVQVTFGKDYNQPKEIDISKIAAVHVFLGQSREEPSTLIISNIRPIE
ncbi:MAG: hypothetical protein ACK5LK_07860 [Chthoniobacterales bacterium]